MSFFVSCLFSFTGDAIATGAAAGGGKGKRSFLPLARRPLAAVRGRRSFV